MASIPARVPELLDAVALLIDRPGDRLARGQVGTIVERLGNGVALVEFSDNEGRAYAIAPIPFEAFGAVAAR